MGEDPKNAPVTAWLSFCSRLLTSSAGIRNLIEAHINIVRTKNSRAREHAFLVGKFVFIQPCQHHHAIMRLVERLENPERFPAGAFHPLLSRGSRRR
jgi:hypothetical protein